MPKNEGGRELEELLPRLHALRIELDKVEEPSAGDRSKPFPPATEAEITAAEKRLHFAFPPSYRAFLRMHNGWRNFSYDWSVFGISGPGWEKASKEWTRECAKFEKYCRRKGPRYTAELREKSKADPSVMYWPDHVPLAVDYNGGFRVFDRHRRHGAGEYEIAEVYAGSEEAINREPDFVAVVKLAMEIARRELATHGHRPEAIEAAATRDALEQAALGNAPPQPDKTRRPGTTKPRTPERKSVKPKVLARRGKRPTKTRPAKRKR